MAMMVVVGAYARGPLRRLPLLVFPNASIERSD
jgi:hypothetical protein